MREVSSVIIKMIMKEYTVMRVIHYFCIEKEVCLFSITVINAPYFHAFTSSAIVILGLSQQRRECYNKINKQTKLHFKRIVPF